MISGEKHPIRQIDRSIYLLTCTGIFAYIIVRAASIPWIHDESTSIYWYVERGEFLPYAALWDAGNHFLSSAIGIVAHKIGGLSLLGSRIGSILAFIIYAWAAYRIGGSIADRKVRWITWCAVLACPFLLDFFSLFRGYGIGMAFWLLAIDGAMRYFRWSRERDLVQLLLALFLADMAVLSLVPLWTLIVAAIGVIELLRWRQQRNGFPWRIGMIWTFLGALPLAFGLLLAWEMRRRALLYHGSTEGFIEVTLSSLSRYVIGSDHPIVLALVGLLIGASIIVIWRKNEWRSIASFIGLMLFADVLMRIGMAWLLKVNYPEDRAALHMVPLAILFIAFTSDRTGGSIVIRTILLIPLLYLPLRTILTANIDHTSLWPEQSVPTRFLQKIADMQRDQGRPLSIGAYHQLSFAIPYAARLNGLDLQPPDVIGFPEGAHDVRITDDRFFDRAQIGHRRLDHSPGNGLHLLQREDPIELREVDRRLIHTEEDVVEFIELWRPDRSMFLRDLRIEVRTNISSQLHFVDLLLVASQELNGETVHYHSIPISHFRPKWKGEELHLIIDLPAKKADGAVVYLWNVKKASIQIGDIEVVIHEVMDGPM